MTNRLTQDQLAQIIAEVEQLSQHREAELDHEEVKQILEELNLPTDLMDEALIQLRRREALKTQQQRRRWMATGVIVVLIGAIATTTVFIQHQQQAIANIGVEQDRLTLANAMDSNLTEIDRQQRPEVYYRVTLKAAPVGKHLSVGCTWLDPAGQVAHQNRWQTRQIDKSLWTTYCRYQVPADATTGRWKVQMSLGDRILSTTSFNVK